LAGGNMQGSCEPPGPGQLWSLYFPREEIPQEINNWVPTGPEARAPLQVCPKVLNAGKQTVNCFSFACDQETDINGVPVATCHCPMGESFAGTPLAAAPCQAMPASASGGHLPGSIGGAAFGQNPLLLLFARRISLSPARHKCVISAAQTSSTTLPGGVSRIGRRPPQHMGEKHE